MPIEGKNKILTIERGGQNPSACQNIQQLGLSWCEGGSIDTLLVKT